MFFFHLGTKADGTVHELEQKKKRTIKNMMKQRRELQSHLPHNSSPATALL
jgi:hypothetical protein